MKVLTAPTKEFKAVSNLIFLDDKDRSQLTIGSLGQGPYKQKISPISIVLPLIVSRSLANYYSTLQC